MHIKKGDNVLIICGKDRNKKAKVLKVFPEKNMVLVEGINLKKKNQKPKKQGEKGQVIPLAAPISASNVKLVCPKCGEASRTGFKVTEKQKFRVCKKCKQEI